MSQEGIDVIERHAQRLVAGSLFALAAYVSFDAVQTLWKAERPSFSAIGVALLLLSIVVMLWLARAKRRLASELGNQTLAFAVRAGAAG